MTRAATVFSHYRASSQATGATTMSGATPLSWLTIVFAIIFSAQTTRNVHAYTTRSYDLDVPGSKPIRIIEADPGWDLNTRKPPIYNRNDRNDRDRSDRVTQSLDSNKSIKNNYKAFTHRGDKDDRFKHRPDFEHRTLKPDVISNRNDRFPADEEDSTDNSENLKKFLNSYAQNVKKINVQVDNSNVDKDTDDQIHLDDKFVDIPTGDHSEEVQNKPEKSKSWNLLHFDKLQDGPQNNKGWVSMDAVPWSVSKISKWHGKPKKDKYQNQNQNQNNGYYNQNSRPYNDRYDVPEYPRPNYPKPIMPNGVIVGQRPSNGYYDDPLEEGDIEDPVEEDYYTNKRPSFPRPSATYGHKVNLHTVQTYGNGNNNNNNNKRPFKDNCNHNHNQNSNKHYNNNNYNPYGHGPAPQQDDGIITDGLPANFPEHDYGNRRRGVAGDSAVSASVSHPFNGEVLPPLDDGRVNMTTSHGGLLEVDATFQSVEEAQKQHAKRQKLKIRSQKRPIRVRPQIGSLNTFTPQQSQAIRQQVLQNGDSIVSASSQGSPLSDSSAVLAAVGAGMIPAGMALLVPMAMSGKRRRRQITYPEYLTVSPYTNTVELTLPSSL